MVSPDGAQVLVVAPARLVPVVRATLETLEPAVRRATEVARTVRPLVGVLARAHAAMPPRGVVVVAASEDEADHALSLGADEVLMDPSDADALRTAIRRAATRASVRSDRAAETRMLEQVIAGLADSMDPPLAALTLDVDALRVGADEVGTGEDQTALDDCASSIERVAHLVRDLHLLVPSLADKGALEVVRLPALVDQVLRILGGALARRAHVERDDDDELPEVLAPRRLLARTLAHVLVQAADALDPGEGPPASRPTTDDTAPPLRRIRVSLRKESDAVAIVIDARPDLDAAPSSAPIALGAPGSLAAAREVLRSFDGELIAERARDGGVRYVMFVPRPEPGVAALVPAAEDSAIPRAKRPRVLLVDGDDRVLRAASRAIAEHYDSVLATSGEEALALVVEGSIDAIVVDHRLPDITPSLFLDELRRRRAELATRVVFVVRTREEAGSLLGSHALEKPIRRAALLNALRDVLSRAQTEPPSRPLHELN
jgi:DNA-binding response OmpR family regulator